jgi:chemotaxis protein methyltransferase WspC
MTEVDFQGLLRRHIGLNVESVGAGLIARAVQDRQAALGLADAEAYWQQLQSSPAELQALIEAVVVSETWFYRDREAFTALVHEARRWNVNSPAGVLRLLSLPCATGEEAYSMSMALLDSGLPKQRFSVTGVDISLRALDLARAALYGSNAFRGCDIDFRDRYFERCASGYQLRDTVRHSVRFEQGNLLSAGVGLGMATYDVVFCRNVLIYLDRAAQQVATSVLVRLTAPGGLLFVGSAETSLITGEEFVSARIPLAFAFRRSRGDAGQSARLRPAVNAPATPRVRRPPPLQAQSLLAFSGAVTTVRADTRPALPTSLDAEAHLAQVAQLADRGLLREAAELGAEHLRRHGPSARLFYIMGLLSEAAHELDAATALHKKALYLEPDHLEALVHLALLLDKQGDVNGAERLRRRARRVTPKGTG